MDRSSRPLANAMMDYFPAIIAFAAILSGCNNKQPPETTTQSRARQREVRREIDQMHKREGRFVLIEYQEGVLCATAVTPGMPDRIAYTLLLRHDAKKITASRSRTLSGTATKLVDVIDLVDKQVALTYSFSRHEETGAIDNETIAIGNETFDLVEGRVFCLDMKGDQPKLLLRGNYTIPTELPDWNNHEARKIFATQMIEVFRQENEAVDNFCRS